MTIIAWGPPPAQPTAQLHLFICVMTDDAPVLTHPGRHVLAGNLTDPVASTAGQGWRGVMLELFPGVDSDFTAVFENHGIALYLNGCVDLYQRFEGKRAHTLMRRGNVVVSPAGIPKKFQYDAGGDCLVVHIAPALLAHIAKSVTPGDPEKVEIVNQFCTRDTEIQRLTLQLWSEYLTQDIASGICAESIAMQLAIQLLRNYSTLAKASQPLSGNLSPRTYERAVEYVEANLPNDLTIQSIASELSMSASHFAHSFKQTTGITPHRYVMERRVEFAKALLRETDIPIANLPTRVGFSTHSHFCVTFQRLTGQTPSAFRSNGLRSGR